MTNAIREADADTRPLEYIGLDMAKFKADMALTPEVEKIISDDMELGRRIGVEGTPTIFVNGKLAQDRSMEYFERLLRQAKGG